MEERKDNRQINGVSSKLKIEEAMDNRLVNWGQFTTERKNEK
jgi:hypothetical protein